MAKIDDIKDDVQTLLDSGNYSHNQIAAELGVHHMLVKRAIEKYTLETYTAFDEEGGPAQLTKGFEWTSEEDALEEMFNQAYEEAYVLIPNSGEVTCDEQPMFGYVKREYGGLHSYAKQRNLTPLLRFFHRQCRVCGETKQLKYFSLRRCNVAGYENTCRDCFADRLKSYDIDYAVHAHRRRAFKMSLPNDWQTRDRRYVRDYFRDACAFTAKSDPHYDHWIALSIGHGGTCRGNMIPINREDNSNKRDANPYEWIRSRPDLDANRFAEIEAYLADVNGLTTDAFRLYVDWCYDNPRSLNEIKADNERYGYVVASVELWREATRVQITA